MRLPDGKYDFEVIRWRIHGEDGDYNLKAEFTLRCLTPPYEGTDVIDAISLSNIKGPMILHQKLKVLGVRGEVKYDADALKEVGRAIVGQKVGAEVATKVSKGGHEYQYFYYLRHGNGENRQSDPDRGNPAARRDEAVEISPTVKTVMRLLNLPPIEME